MRGFGMQQVLENYTYKKNNSNSNSNLTKLNNSTVAINTDKELEKILRHSFSDIIPDDGYYPFYVRQIKDNGLEHFTNLINQVRLQGGSIGLLNWFLKNPDKVQLGLKPKGNRAK